MSRRPTGLLERTLVACLLTPESSNGLKIYYPELAPVLRDTRLLRVVVEASTNLSRVSSLLLYALQLEHTTCPDSTIRGLEPSSESTKRTELLMRTTILPISPPRPPVRDVRKYGTFKLAIPGMPTNGQTVSPLNKYFSS